LFACWSASHHLVNGAANRRRSSCKGNLRKVRRTTSLEESRVSGPDRRAVPVTDAPTAVSAPLRHEAGLGAQVVRLVLWCSLRTSRYREVGRNVSVIPLTDACPGTVIAYAASPGP
jgi:hypothetical protein